jgi:hypothetical protein
MPVASNTLRVLADLADRRFRVRAVAGSVRVSPASALTDADRQAIRQNRGGLLGLLAETDVWDLPAVIGWVCDADELVERLGVRRTHPEVLALARTAVAVQRLENMTAMRSALAEFTALVRRLADGSPTPGPANLGTDLVSPVSFPELDGTSTHSRSSVNLAPRSVDRTTQLISENPGGG